MRGEVKSRQSRKQDPARSPTAPANRAERVEACMAIMRTGDWKRGVTGPELATAWGMARTTLDDIAAEAWRRVQAEVVDKPRIQVFALTKLERIAKASMRDARRSDKPGMERRVAVAALDSMLRFAAGATDGMGPVWDRLTDDEKWQRIDEAEARIAAVKAKLPPRKALTT